MFEALRERKAEMPWTEKDDERVREFCKDVDVGKLTVCPKCAMGSNPGEMILASFCTHSYCPFREWSQQKKTIERAADPYFAALDKWKSEGGVRPAKRPDGLPTRIDIQWMTPAEVAIRDAMLAVENAGGSVALTDAVTLLSKARDRVADHVEGERQ
jgi:hypothetical protein